ncbi:MAG: hypothetical protein ACOC7V_15615, partial [Spirochaetota bacterium]
MTITQQRESHSRRTAIAAFVGATLLLLALAGCDAAGDAEETVAEPSRPNDWPTVTTRQAGEAVSDAMLITSQALYLAIATGTEAREVRSADDLLRLSWSEDADFLTGNGSYEISLDGYTIAADDRFAEHYHGYALTGTISLESEPGADTRVAFVLDSDHEDADRYPARRIELRLGPGESEAFVRVNDE